MRPTTLILLAFVTTLGVSAAPAAAPAPAPTKAPAKAPELTTEQRMAQFRDDMQSHRADIMAKGLTLNAEQASKFWPLYEQFQKEQNVIIDGQLASVQKYAAAYNDLKDADSLAYVTALLDRDQQICVLRSKWLAKFQTVVSPGTAARAIQLDRRLSQVAQVMLSQQIPLAH